MEDLLRRIYWGYGMVWFWGSSAGVRWEGLKKSGGIRVERVSRKLCRVGEEYLGEGFGMKGYSNYIVIGLYYI